MIPYSILGVQTPCIPQADVLHGFSMLLSNGIRADNIITFMYDDIAYNQVGICYLVLL